MPATTYPTIEDNIPLPPHVPNGYRYPWRDLQPNNSFFVELPNATHAELERLRNSIHGAARTWARRNAKQQRHQTAVVDDPVHGCGVRCWRLEDAAP